MRRIKRDGLLQIRKRLSQLAIHEPRCRAGMVAFGKIRSVVDQGSEMLYCHSTLAIAHRIPPALQQQIGTG